MVVESLHLVKDEALVRVRVHIVGSDPEIWRLLDVSERLRLDELHIALQVVFGWEDTHLHAFMDTDPRTRTPNGQSDVRRWGDEEFVDDDDNELLAEDNWMLGEVLTKDSGPLFYEYNFSDEWLHRLDWIETNPRKRIDPPAKIVHGERRGPLEESGGISGYYEILQVINDPKHGDHDPLSEWVRGTVGPGECFNPDAFDIDRSNRELMALVPST